MAKKTVQINIGIAKTHGRGDNQIGFLVEKYIERHPNCLDERGAIDLNAIIDWAFDSKLYQPRPADPRAQLRRRVRRHLGQRYIRDDKGRDARALIAVPVMRATAGGGVQHSFDYYPLYDSPAQTIYRGLDMRRGWAYKRVEQIVDDRESYNDFNRLGEKIPEMSFDFDELLARKKMPTTYPTNAPEDVDDDDDSVD